MGSWEGVTRCSGGTSCGGDQLLSIVLPVSLVEMSDSWFAPLALVGVLQSSVFIFI